MSEDTTTSRRQQDASGKQGPQRADEEADDSQGHLMVRTDETVTPSRKLQDPPLRP